MLNFTCCEGGNLLTSHLSFVFECEVERLIYMVGLKIYWLKLWIKLGLTKLFSPSVVSLDSLTKRLYTSYVGLHLLRVIIS